MWLSGRFQASGFRLQASGAQNKNQEIFAQALQKYLPLLLLLALMACGFEPMYGDADHRTTHTPLEGNMTVTGLTGREGQLLKIAIEDKFNPEGLTTSKPQYHLNILYTKSLNASIMKSDGTIQRYDVKLDSTFTLTQDGVKEPLLQGKVQHLGSYNVISNAEFATFSADRDITERAINEMGEDYLLRLTSYFAGKNENNAAK